MLLAVFALLSAFLRPAEAASQAVLKASVVSSFPGKSTSLRPSSPAIFSFTTSSKSFYELSQVELRVVFVQNGTNATTRLLGAPADGCHDLIAETSINFPSPLGCYSGNFSTYHSDEWFFGIRFSALRTLQRSSSYRFVVPYLQILREGGRSNFSWRFEFWPFSGQLAESVMATLAQDIWDQPESCSFLRQFGVRGGQNLLPGSWRYLELVFNLFDLPNNSRLLLTLFPILLFDQKRTLCSIGAGSSPASCQHIRADPSLGYYGYNQILVSPISQNNLTGEFMFRIRVVVPSAAGFMPSALSVSVLLTNATTRNRIACGPYFDGNTSTSLQPIEVNSYLHPIATVSAVGNRMEMSINNPVTIMVRPRSILRGYDFLGAPRRVALSVTTSNFFEIGGASSVSQTAALGTDRTPLLSISTDKRTVTFEMTHKRCLVLAHVEYTMRLFINNPLRYFWLLTAADPWIVSLAQGPRLGCQGCPTMVYNGSFQGPSIDFALREFNALPGSRKLGALSSLVFVFQLLNAAERVELVLPSGAIARSCNFHQMDDVDFWARRFVQCLPQVNSLDVVNRAPGQPFESLPTGWLLSFSAMVQNPASWGSGSANFSARAFSTLSTFIGGTRSSDQVQMLLYPSNIPVANVSAQDFTPNVTSVITVSFKVSNILQPGDFIRVTAPPGFRWNFIASEFSSKPSGLTLKDALPVRIPSANAVTNALSLDIIGAVLANQNYGFSAQLTHSVEQPVDYRWSLETFGPGALFAPSERFQTSTLEPYKLSLLVDVQISPWTRVRSSAGPVTVSFKTTHAVPVNGKLIIRSPVDTSFTASCAISTLQFALGDQSSVTAIPVLSVDCSVITANQMHLSFTTKEPFGFRGLQAGVKYSVTVHSLTNSAGTSWNVGSMTWYLETVDASQVRLDVANAVQGYFVADQLPHAELALTGPSMGADSRAGSYQWVTLAFQVHEQTWPQQLLELFATPSFVFETYCSVRDPPVNTGDWSLVSSQLSNCQAHGSVAQLVIQAVWFRRMRNAFQIQVKNQMPSSVRSASSLENVYLNTWRLCINGCRQMHTNISSASVMELKSLALTSTSNVVGDSAILVVRFVLSTSMPPSGLFRVRAPNGYIFPLFCSDFFSHPGGGFFSIPWGTTCEGGGFGSGSSIQQGNNVLQARDFQLTIGSHETSRLLANKPYVFTIGMINPSRDVWPVIVAWEVRTFTPHSSMLDAIRTSDVLSASGKLLYPMLGILLHYSSAFANVPHALTISFRPLATAEGGDTDIIRHVNRLQVFAPENEDLDVLSPQNFSSEWNLLSPAACTAPFTTRDGRQVTGIQHANMTTQDGSLVCLPAGVRSISLTFQPSTVTVRNPVTLEFLVQNPDTAPRTLWNRWKVRLFHVWPSVRAEAAQKTTADLAVQSTLFDAVTEANFLGFSVIQAFQNITILPSEYSINFTANVQFQLWPRSDIPLNAQLLITAPSGFVALTSASALAVFNSNPHTAGLSVIAGQQPHQVIVAFGNPHPLGSAVHFVLAIRNPPLPPISPLWDFELTRNNVILQRTSGFQGFNVYYSAEVVGLFGSVREIGSKYNFARITFRLSGPLGKAGTLRVVAPPGFKLLTTGFSRDNLPAFSAPTVLQPGVIRNPLELNVSVPFGLRASTFYAFSFGVENPPTQQAQPTPWELWCINLDGTVVAANRNVPPFKLEARFRNAEVLPSSVIPLKSSNTVEVRVTFDSSPLNVVRSALQNDVSLLILEFPLSFSLSSMVGSAGTANTSFACNLDVRMLGHFSSTTSVLTSLPPGSICHVVSPQRLGIEVQETLHLGQQYYFALELVNPLATPQANTWQITTSRNGRMLHSATDVQNFAIAEISSAAVVPTDVRFGVVQMLFVQMLPPRHVRGYSVIELRAPQGFTLQCAQNGKTPPLGVIPADTECLIQGSALSMRLPRPFAYAPYVPQLLDGQSYNFAVFCANPVSLAALGSALANKFEVRLVDAWPASRIIGLRANLPAPSLAVPLDLLEVSAGATVNAGQPAIITVRFRVPSQTNVAGDVQAIFLLGPVGMILSDGASTPCKKFQSKVQATGDAVLPQSVCTGLSQTSVIIQLPDRLILSSPQLGALKYVFELEVTLPQMEVLIDSFLLTLSPGPGANPLFASTATGFAGRVLGVSPVQLPALPAEYAVPVPQDSSQAPLSTVNLVTSIAKSLRPVNLGAMAFVTFFASK